MQMVKGRSISCFLTGAGQNCLIALKKLFYLSEVKPGLGKLYFRKKA
jgi:hypothetical protein